MDTRKLNHNDLNKLERKIGKMGIDNLIAIETTFEDEINGEINIVSMKDKTHILLLHATSYYYSWYFIWGIYEGTKLLRQ